MVDDPDHDTPDEPVPVWDDAQFFRAVALLAWEAEQEDDAAFERAPNYDW